MKNWYDIKFFLFSFAFFNFFRLSRKKRYFVLRKDIRSLCYYASREDLTLLGSIPLDIDTKLANVKPEDADGYQNVVAIETDFEDGSSLKTFIRSVFNLSSVFFSDNSNCNCFSLDSKHLRK
jgi:hypothetical protein